MDKVGIDYGCLGKRDYGEIAVGYEGI